MSSVERTTHMSVSPEIPGDAHVLQHCRFQLNAELMSVGIPFSGKAETSSCLMIGPTRYSNSGTMRPLSWTRVFSLQPPF